MIRSLLLYKENVRHNKYESEDETNTNTCSSCGEHKVNTCRT